MDLAFLAIICQFNDLIKVAYSQKSLSLHDQSKKNSQIKLPLPELDFSSFIASG